MIFCDTSAVAKLYVNEAETPAVRARLESEDQVLISELARAELLSVFHRQLREGAWTSRQFKAAVAQFLRDDMAGFWTWLPLDEVTTRDAARTFETLPASVALRSADCLHIVTALRAGCTEILTYDRHQTAAANALGLTPAQA